MCLARKAPNGRCLAIQTVNDITTSFVHKMRGEVIISCCVDKLKIFFGFFYWAVLHGTLSTAFLQVLKKNFACTYQEKLETQTFVYSSVQLKKDFRPRLRYKRNVSCGLVFGKFYTASKFRNRISMHTILSQRISNKNEHTPNASAYSDTDLRYRKQWCLLFSCFLTRAPQVREAWVHDDGNMA